MSPKVAAVPSAAFFARPRSVSAERAHFRIAAALRPKITFDLLMVSERSDALLTASWENRKAT